MRLQGPEGPFETNKLRATCGLGIEKLENRIEIAHPLAITTTLEELGGRTTDRLEKLQRLLRIAHWHTMRPSRPLSMYSARLTLFTRSNCSLCDVAKSKIAEVQKKRTLEYNEVDVMAPGQKQWKQLYQYETPVLHIERVFHTNPKPNVVTEAKKLWHRFSAEDIEKLVDEAEQGVA